MCYLKLLIHLQTDYINGRFIGESIRSIADIIIDNNSSNNKILNLSMVSYIIIKKQNIPRLAIFLDFEKAFDAIE